MRATFLLSLLALLLAAPPSATLQAQVRSWELRDGRWQAVETPATQPVAEPVLDRAEQLLENQQATAAKKLLVPWLKAHKQSPLRDRALYLLGQANFLYGDRIRAFYNFDELLDKHPDSPLFQPALQRQYDIAEAFLSGYKLRFLLMPILGAEDEAVEMLYRIQQRAPGSPLAEKALLRTANYYYQAGDYDLAADTYAAYVRSYPRSPAIPRVRLQQAFAALAQYRGARFDATPVIDARQQLADLMAVNPELAREENLPALVQGIDRALAAKFLTRADFYRRTHKPQAAGFYYRYVLSQFPHASEAAEARRRLERLPASAQQPPPPLEAAAGPATRSEGL